MAQGKNMNVVETPTTGPPPLMQNSQQIRLSLRKAIRTRICTILQNKIPQRNDDASRIKCAKISAMIENKLCEMAETEEDYCDLRSLGARTDSLLKELQRVSHQQNKQRADNETRDQTVTPSRGMVTSNSNGNLAAPTFQSGTLPSNNCTTGGSSFNGFPSSSGDSTMPVFNNTAKLEPLYSDGGNVTAFGFEPQRQQTGNANYNMVGGYGSNIHQVTSGMCTPHSNGLGISRNSVPLTSGPMTSYGLHSSTHMPTLSAPLVQVSNSADCFGPNNLYGGVRSSSSMAVSRDTVPLKSNPVVRVNGFNQLNMQGMQQTTLPKRQQFRQPHQSASTVNGNMSQGSQQHLNHGFYKQARDIDLREQHSKQHYSGQLQKQDQLLNVDAYQTQLTTGLATRVKHEPSLESCKEALQKQAMNGFKPSNLQYQQNAVKDHHVGAQSAAIHTSLSYRAHPQQNQLASVMAQKPSSLQSSAQISESNNGERERVGVKLCQSSPMQPCSSAKAPIIRQTVTDEKKRLPDGNSKSNEQVNEDPNVRNKIRWLLFMVHADSCTEDKCESEHCPAAKELLKHIYSCKVPDCTYRFCVETQELLRHYKKCKNKSCPVCVPVNNRRKKFKILHVKGAKCQPKESSESMQANSKRGAEALSVDVDLQPLVKRPRVLQDSRNATRNMENSSVPACGVACKSPPSMAKLEEKDDLQSDNLKNVKVEVKPMDIDISAASSIPVTVIEDTCCLSVQEETKCMNEMSAAKEEKVSKKEVSSLVELFTPKQVKEHIRGLRQWVGQSKTKAEKNKAMGHSMSVNSCQLCAVERLIFEPIPIYCTPCGSRIKRNALHYSVVSNESQHYVCIPCYNGVHENFISLGGNSISKARLAKKKNDDQIEEGWVQCDKCLAWQHQICALFNGRRNHGEETKYTCPTCYIQEVEHGEREPLPESAIPGARSLPVTALSNHIEERLFKTLKKERQERARFQGKSYDEVPGAESLAVRVVASVDKVLEVKEHFFKLFRDENYPSEFPYKSKAILLFQKIESVEVCLFGMFVQEFGTECGPPNQRRIYLSYLDSVKYFRPEVRTVSGEALRTFVYHEILIGYLDYCKKRGFTSCYIWACPPLKGEDYILNCHPEIQKTPKTDKLREWYLAMLRKASKEDVVVECTNLYDQFFVQSGECRANVTAARLPYFDGDYWPGAAEDLIHQMNQEDDGTKLNRKGPTKKVISKRALRAVGQLDLTANASKDRLTMQKLGEIICPLKEDFIMVHLQHFCKHCCTHIVSGHRWVCNQCKNFQICDKCHEAEQERLDEERHPTTQKEKHTLFPVAIEDVPIETQDKDDNIESEFFDNRQAFLTLCQGNNYQYDTLRRAKHSSMMLLYHLHNPTVPAFATTCIICQQEVENSQGWHCGVCPGYNVCTTCYAKASIDHPHNLIRRSSGTDTGVPQKGQANQNYQIQHEKLKELLIHAMTCRTIQCEYPRCLDMKKLYRHCLSCKVGAKGCGLCKKIWGLLHLHARGCRDTKCTVPKCREYRAHISMQQQQSDKRRRAAVKEMVRKRAAETTHT